MSRDINSYLVRKYDKIGNVDISVYTCQFEISDGIHGSILVGEEINFRYERPWSPSNKPWCDPDEIAKRLSPIELVDGHYEAVLVQVPYATAGGIGDKATHEIGYHMEFIIEKEPMAIPVEIKSTNTIPVYQHGGTRTIVGAKSIAVIKKLIHCAARFNGHIVCIDSQMVDEITMVAKNMKVDINYPITYNEFINRDYGFTTEGFHIYDVSSLLAKFSPSPILTTVSAGVELK